MPINADVIQDSRGTATNDKSNNNVNEVNSLTAVLQAFCETCSMCGLHRNHFATSFAFLFHIIFGLFSTNGFSNEWKIQTHITYRLYLHNLLGATAPHEFCHIVYVQTVV